MPALPASAHGTLSVEADPAEVVMAPAQPEPDFGREWAVTGSNRRPPACKAGALPAELTARAARSLLTDAKPGRSRHGREAAGLRPARCPQRDSNPRYGLERAATWTASRWGPGPARIAAAIERPVLPCPRGSRRGPPGPIKKRCAPLPVSAWPWAPCSEVSLRPSGAVLASLSPPCSRARSAEPPGCG
jgi:hypothetical protein